MDSEGYQPLNAVYCGGQRHTKMSQNNSFWSERWTESAVEDPGLAFWLSMQSKHAQTHTRAYVRACAYANPSTITVWWYFACTAVLLHCLATSERSPPSNAGSCTTTSEKDTAVVLSNNAVSCCIVSLLAMTAVIFAYHTFCLMSSDAEKH